MKILHSALSTASGTTAPRRSAASRAALTRYAEIVYYLHAVVLLSSLQIIAGLRWFGVLSNGRASFRLAFSRKPLLQPPPYPRVSVSLPTSCPFSLFAAIPHTSPIGMCDYQNLLILTVVSAGHSSTSFPVQEGEWSKQSMHLPQMQTGTDVAHRSTTESELLWRWTV